MSATEAWEAGLLPALRAGGRRAEKTCERLLDNWAGPLVNYLSRMTGNRAIGEELAQEALARLIREAAVLRPEGSLRGWLWTVATNLGRDHLRHKRFELASAPAVARSAETSGTDPLETQELKDAVQAVLAHLPEPDRLCLLMKDVEELPYGILAEVLSVTPEAARVRVHRARERFRDLYRTLDGNEEVRHAIA